MRTLLKTSIANRTGLLLVALALTFAGGWRLWVIASQPTHLLEIAAEIGSIAQTREGVFPNHTGSMLVYLQETESGMGTFFCDTSSGQSHLLIEQKEKGYGDQYRLIGWSPDDHYLAYATLSETGPTNLPKSILLFEGTSGAVVAQIPAEAYAKDSQFVWLSSSSFVYSTFSHRSWLVFAQKPDGKWVQTQVVKRFADGVLKNLTVISLHSVAWLTNGEIRTFDFSSGASVKIWQSTTNQLRSFTYAAETGNYLLNCQDDDGLLAISYRPPRFEDEPGTILNLVRNPERSRYADLDMGGGRYSFNLKMNTNSEPTAFVWEGMLRYYALGGDSLFFTGNKPDGVPGIWQFDTQSKTTRCLASGLTGNLKYAKIAVPLNETGTNDAGQQIGYHLWEPTEVKPGKKYPLILGQSLYVWNPCPQVAANAGYYYATANLTNWINNVDTWPEQVMGLYQILARNPNIDTNRIYLIAYSAQALDIDQMAESNSDFYKGLILFHPAGLPDFSKFRRAKIFLVGGTDDKDSPPEQLIKYQYDAASDGIPVIFIIQDGVQHITRSVATEREQALQLTRFLMQP